MYRLAFSASFKHICYGSTAIIHFNGNIHFLCIKSASGNKGQITDSKLSTQRNRSYHQRYVDSIMSIC